MKVVLLNHSDSRGGASVATYRLLQALREQGIDARLLVMHRTCADPDVEVLTPALRRKAAFLIEHAQIFMANGFSRKYLFKASIATCGMDVHNHPWVREADVVVLEWVNQGMLSLAEISRIKAPLVWVMHDMWCLTGVCHHAGQCHAYTEHCGHCPLAFSGRFKHDMSWSTFSRKLRLYSTKQIHFVAVSSWLKQKCEESALMRGQKVRTITNPFDIEAFTGKPLRSREELGLPSGWLVVMGAARLDDPIKGLDKAIEALNIIAGDGGGLSAVFFGDLRDPHALEGLRLPYVHLGPITDTSVLADVYAHAKVVLSTSQYETLGLTLIEGMASGCVPVTFAHGGQGDIVDHMVNGYIARYGNANDVARGIRWGLTAHIKAEDLRRTAFEKFGFDSTAKEYIKLFNEIINDEI